MEFAELAAIGGAPTPNELQPVLVRLLEQGGGVGQRRDLVRAIEAEWSAAGGTPEPDSRTTTRVKKALGILKRQGIVGNPTYSTYRLLGEVSQLGDDCGGQVADEAPEDDLEDIGSAEAELQVGSGDQFVYAFYLPQYRQAAEDMGRDRWSIKIGMTTQSVAVRMASHRTALPEPPCLHLVIRTENAALLEKVLHGLLTLRGRRSDDSGGSEWFITNGDEIISLYQATVSPS